MALRPAVCYRSLKDRPYTRIAVTVPDRNYIGTNPSIKTRQFNMGNGIADFKHVVDLISDGYGLVRDNALEAARILITSNLNYYIKKEGFFIKVRVYPFHVLRENKQAQGAGADRVSTGMSHPFGRPIGRAVRIKPGKVILSVLVDEEDVPAAIKCLNMAKAKLPVPIQVKAHMDVASIGTRPKKIKLMKEETEEAKEGEAAPAEGAAPA
ncbi:MAG: 50S ribosomal protein L16, partial [Candidatus Diapherotrites archaeon]|nr:50S ribosomal protein L16 [Candidatus Diapherotrites archaeon]